MKHHSKNKRLTFFAIILLCTVGLSLPKLARAAQSQPVCKVGNSTYSSLQDAVDAINSSGTITLISDVALISDEPRYVPVVKIANGKTITLQDDGTKRTISSNHPMFDVTNATLTIKGTAKDKLIFKGGSFNQDDKLNCDENNPQNNKTKGYIVTVNHDATLNFDEGTIDGGSPWGATTGAIGVAGSFTCNKHNQNGHSNCELAEDHSAHLNLNGGVIKNIKTNSPYLACAPVLCSDYSKIHLKDTEICNNSFNNCAGIYAVNYVDIEHGDTPYNIELTMDGGSIHDNKGDALYLSCGCTFKMNGGEIYNNNCADLPNPLPGTIFVANTSSMTMTGGKIHHNKALSGGAIYLKNSRKNMQHSLKLLNGEITDNSALSFGGAIFSENYYIDLYLENTVISDNTALQTGGGLWCCPLGTAKVNLQKGVAIFDNRAHKAGDDIVNMNRSDANPMPAAIELSNFALGGGEITYYKDGFIAHGEKTQDRGMNNPYWVGIIDENAQRAHISGSPFDIHNITADENIALKSSMSESAKQAARNNARVIIKNNTASYGGGIATNTASTFGEYISIPWKFEVKKHWKDLKPDSDTEIEVALLSGKEQIRTAKLNAQNGWSATFDNLPDPKTVLGGFSVIEKTQGYKVTYSPVTIDTAHHLLTQTIINAPADTTPPETPTPEIPVPNQPTPQNPQRKKALIPKTSDVIDLSKVTIFLVLGSIVLYVANKLNRVSE